MEGNEKITAKGWISLIILLIMLSGIFMSSEGPLAAIDFSNLSGKFGEIYEGLNFTGSGGNGAKDGFLVGLTLVPTVMLFSGLIAVFEKLGAFAACKKVFQPILKPLIGIPGDAGVAFISSFTGSDVAAVMTKELVEEGQLTDDERTIFVAFQYAASAPVTNTIGLGAPMLAISPLSSGVIIVIEIICKLIGANFVRLVIGMGKKKRGMKEHE